MRLVGSVTHTHTHVGRAQREGEFLGVLEVVILWLRWRAQCCWCWEQRLLVLLRVLHQCLEARRVNVIGLATLSHYGGRGSTGWGSPTTESICFVSYFLWRIRKAIGEHAVISVCDASTNRHFSLSFFLALEIQSESSGCRRERGETTLTSWTRPKCCSKSETSTEMDCPRLE